MAKRALTEQERNHSVSAVINSMFLLESIDALRETTVYSKNIKKYGNIFMNCLTNLINQNDAIQKANSTITNNLFIDSEAIRKKLCKNNIKDLVMINQIHDYYKDNPEEWNSFYQFRKLND